jgi:Porphobilinogen deaminase, dipyromethane cofactor binding domain
MERLIRTDVYAEPGARAFVPPPDERIWLVRASLPPRQDRFGIGRLDLMLEETLDETGGPWILGLNPSLAHINLRLRKLEAAEVDATLLAVAGLKRLSL